MAGPWEDYKPQAAAASAAGPWTDYQTPAKAPAASTELSMPDRAMRAVGLAGRAAAPIVAGMTAGAAGGALIGGVGAIPGALAGGGAAALAPVLADVVNWIRGGDKAPSEQVEQILDKAFPKPASATERVVYDVNRALASTAGTVGAARQLADTAGTALGRKAASMMAANPGAQALAAVGGSAAGGTARESGAGPAAQIAAGIAGSYAAPAVVGTAKAAGRLTKAILDTTGLRGDAGTEAAVQRILADALGSPKVLGMGAADDIAGASVGTIGGAGNSAPGAVAGMVRDPRAVARSLENVPEFVPGSRPTTAQASGSTELAILERGIAASNPRFQAMLDERMAANNLARQNELRRLAGGAEIASGPNAGMTPGMVSAEAKRTAVTAPLREQSLQAVRAQGVYADELGRQLARMETTPGIRASNVASGAIADIRQKIAGFTAADGTIHPDDLYMIRKEIGNTIQKFAQENQNFDKRYTAGLASQVQAMMDDAITQSGAKDWKQYLSKYSRMSKPIEQMETVAGIRKGAENALVLQNPITKEAEYALSQAKFKNLFTNKLGEMSEILTPAQMKRLENVAADLDRGSLSNTGGRSVGSNTAQNLSTAYVLGQVLGGDAQAVAKWPVIARSLNFITRLNENDVQDTLARIMLDPKLAKTMLEKATPRTVESIVFEMKQSAKASGIGSAQSAAQTKKGQ